MAAGTLTVQNVVTNVRELLGDKETGGSQWLDAELLAWLNEGALEIIRIRPEASAVTVAGNLVAGTQQSLPNDCLLPLTFDYNGSNASPGRVCKMVSRRQLDVTTPDWHTHTRRKEVQWVASSESNNQLFWVYPPNDGTGQLTYTYSKYPTTVTTLGEVIPVANTYLAPLVDYICYRAYQKQLESKESQGRAGEHRQLFENAMGVTNKTFVERGANARLGAGVI